MTLYAYCRDVCSCSYAVNEDILEDLQKKIKLFMNVCRWEVAARSQGHITPKLRLLENPVLKSMCRFCVGLGLLGDLLDFDACLEHG